MSTRLLNPISTAELERRWKALRKIMSDRGVGALVVQNNNDWFGGYVKWLTDLPATNGYPTSVIFHLDDWMTVVDMGAQGGRRTLDGADEVYRGVGEIRTTPAFTSISYTFGYQAMLVLQDLKYRNYGAVAVAGGGALPHQFIQGIKDNLATTQLIDLTDEVDLLKALKSPEEIAGIRNAAAMQDRVFRRVTEKIRPGMRDYEITAIAQYEGRMLGSEQGLFLGSSARLGNRSGFVDRHLQGRTIEQGDNFTLLIENNGPGGFYTEMARTIVLGKASQELKDGFAAMLLAQEHTLSLLRPGALCKEVADAHDEYMRTRGLPEERRLYSHGQGYDLVERPLIRADDSMRLVEGMNLAVHPGYETETLFAVICDNYIVEENGVGDCLHQTEKKIFEL